MVHTRKREKEIRSKARQKKLATKQQKPIRSSGSFIWLLIFFGGILWVIFH